MGRVSDARTGGLADRPDPDGGVSGLHRVLDYAEQVGADRERYRRARTRRRTSSVPRAAATLASSALRPVPVIRTRMI
jgi:hypothetical protein